MNEHSIRLSRRLTTLNALLFAVSMILIATESYAQDFVKGEILVKLKEGDHDQELNVVNTQLGSRIQWHLSNPRILNIQLPSSISEEAAVRTFSDRAFVELADRNWIINPVLSATNPNDPNFSQQWHLNQTSNIDIDAPEAWDKTTGSASVVVALADTGIDVDHPDLAGNLWTDPGTGRHGWNFNDNNDDINDTYGHGTFVAGLAGAVGNNGQHVTGTAWSVKIMMLRIFSDTGNPTQEEVINAYRYARDRGVKIISNSWNLQYDVPMLINEIRAMAADNVLFVFSAGNGPYLDFDHGVNIDSTPFASAPPPPLNSLLDKPNVFPCKHQSNNLLCTAAVDKTGLKPGFSNWGVKSVQLAAPGTEMFTSLNVRGFASVVD